MDELMKLLLSLSISGTLLLLIIWGGKRLYKNKFSRRWQYYIWIIAALRFLVPFTPDTTLVGNLFKTLDAAEMTDKSPINPDVTTHGDAGGGAGRPEQESGDEAAPAAASNPVELQFALFLVWAAGTLILLVRRITLYQSFVQSVRAGNTEVSDIQTLNLLSDCEEKWKIRTRVELYRNDWIASPMMIGFFRPGIVLPEGELDDRELSYVLAHELVHCRQRDMFYKWLIQIVVCVHWFNPVVYRLEKEVNRCCELSCDEAVISVLDDGARREYGDTLLSFLKSNHFYRSSLASVTLTEGAEQIKERLGAIMKYGKKSRSVRIATAVFTGILCLCFGAAGAYAMSADDGGSAAAREGQPSAAYARLTAYKTGDYAQQSIADFNASLAPTPDEFSEILAALAEVGAEISREDENYGFIQETMTFSSQELFNEHMGEEPVFFGSLQKFSRPNGFVDEEGEPTYDFTCFVDFVVNYHIHSPEMLTVGERDATILTFRRELQDYLDGLSEAEITGGSFKEMLDDKAGERMEELSSDRMELLSCEFSLIEIIGDGGEEVVQ